MCKCILVGEKSQHVGKGYTRDELSDRMKTHQIYMNLDLKHSFIHGNKQHTHLNIFYLLK